MQIFHICCVNKIPPDTGAEMRNSPFLFVLSCFFLFLFKIISSIIYNFCMIWHFCPVFPFPFLLLFSLSSCYFYFLYSYFLPPSLSLFCVTQRAPRPERRSPSSLGATLKSSKKAFPMRTLISETAPTLLSSSTSVTSRGPSRSK